MVGWADSAHALERGAEGERAAVADLSGDGGDRGCAEGVSRSGLDRLAVALDRHDQHDHERRDGT
jgi:hypothetical protein